MVRAQSSPTRIPVPSKIPTAIRGQPSLVASRTPADDGTSVGLSSRDATKPGLRVDFDRYVTDQKFLNLKSFALRNNTQDASGMHERLSMALARKIGILEVPREAHTKLYINNEKRAQIIYDPPLANDEDQLALSTSQQHQVRLAELPAGKHVVDVWIYKQSEDADNPEPLAAGEFQLRK